VFCGEHEFTIQFSKDGKEVCAKIFSCSIQGEGRAKNRRVELVEIATQ